MSFDSLGLSPELLRAVAAQGYVEPTPVQAEAIPLVLAGRDVLAGAQTGTGKTAAFVLPILQRLHATAPSGTPTPSGAAQPSGDRRDADRRDAGRRPIRVLVLTPTRELALQVEESVRTYGATRPVRSTTIYGGVGFGPQVGALRRGADIVVATPGRLLDHVGQGTIDLSRVEVLVLDEADRMLDMGFIRDIRKILALLPVRRQNLLFSATFSDDIRRLADGLLHEPAFVQVARRNTAAELVRQLVHPVDRERKRELLSHLVRSRRLDQTLVFTRTKHGANRLAEQLDKDGIAAAAIHGNKSQPQRVRALADFKAGRVTVLVATDIAARGLDIDALPHVVNYELPMVPEDYVHRIGRTGRAGVEGEAISLVCVDEGRMLRDIEDVLRHRIPSEVVPGFEPDRSIRPEPIRLRSAGHRPLHVGHHPAHAGGRPAQGGIRPARVGGRPGQGGKRPTPIGNRPGQGGNRPTPIGNRPTPIGNRPALGGNHPAGPRSMASHAPERHVARPQGPRDRRDGTARGSRPQGGQGTRLTLLPGERLARHESGAGTTSID